MPLAAAEALKAEGNAFFKGGNYPAAIEKYGAASQVDPTVPAYHSNAAACWEKIGNYTEMESAARACISADKSFVKGYFRLATALNHLKQYSACIKALESGLAIQSSNSDLKRMKTQVVESLRKEQVEGYITKAKSLESSDIVNAYKTIELASRMDASSPQVINLMNRIKPKYEASERARKSGLSPTERFKEQGDECYKSANFEGAIGFYTKCIDALRSEGKSSSPLILKAYSNRAACYKQISNFDGTIEDCTNVLEVEPENIKALIRRAQAFEGVERYRFALQDCKTVLGFPYEKVGKANFDLCNMMQHRLNRTVQQLKKMG